MAYEFAGFFAKPVVAQPDELPAGAVWRIISSPFVGVGVRLPELLDNTPSAAQVTTLAQQLGFTEATDWVCLKYVCWGGAIDFVSGLGSRKGRPFGAIEESTQDKVVAAYTNLMGAFGVSAEDAMHFPPFVRGLWGVA